MCDQSGLPEFGSECLYYTVLGRFSVCFLPFPTRPFTHVSALNRHIEYEFGQFGPSSETHYGYFNATTLNNAAEMVNSTFALGYPLAPGFLFTTLLSNAGGPGILDGSNTTGPSTTPTSNSNTGIAM